MEIGIDVENLSKDRDSRGRMPSGPYMLRCRALGLELRVETLGVGLQEMRRLRIERLSQMAAERPADPDLMALLREARQDVEPERDAMLSILEASLCEHEDEVPAPVETPLTVRQRQKAVSAWRKEMRAARKNELAERRNSARQR